MKKMTEANLKEAFAGESQAHMKYLIFADKAEREGFSEVARLFQAIAYAERVHATNHLRQLDGIKDTLTNLQVAIDGENYENEEMYPTFGVVAKFQEHKGATRSFHYAEEAEKIHEVMYKDAKKRVESGKDIEKAEGIWVCSVCGHTHIGDQPDKCPVCGVKGSKYRKF
jgi:rubrerythrin